MVVRFLLVAGVLCVCRPVAAQEAGGPAERWSIHLQATSIGQYHGSFRSLYEGRNSLPPHPEARVSLTSTAFLAYRINSWTELVVNPEVAGGKGFGQVTGIAGFTNGEIPRVAQAMPALYAARAYIRNTWAIGPGTVEAEDGPNEIAGPVPMRRFTWITGKFAMTDFFDDNTYSHDPRRQFMNWALMSNGAWDYPADVRGYTVGAVQELAMRTWSLRAATVLEPTAANGPTLDTRVTKNRGEAVEWEQRYRPGGQAGALRILGFWNRERAGAYRQAMLADGPADLAATRRPGAKKYGFGVNAEQQITHHIGAFARYGWNDGKTESWAFTEIDRTASGGLSFQGRLWRRPGDTIGVASVRNYLSGDHRSFLAAGGAGFIVGDGRLNYGPESIAEIYYAGRVSKECTLALDWQHISNPAYNRARGPLPVLSLRVHWER
jgi:high affinity Mn2+ porin